MGASHDQTCPLLPNPNLRVQIIEFTFTHDRFTDQAIKTKRDKYKPLITAIKEQGWKVNPLISLRPELGAPSTHKSIKTLKTLKSPPKKHYYKNQGKMSTTLPSNISHALSLRKDVDNMQEPIKPPT